jgi:hypothetical protein
MVRSAVVMPVATAPSREWAGPDPLIGHLEFVEGGTDQGRWAPSHSVLRPGHGDHQRPPDRRSCHLFCVVSEPGAER